MAQESSGDGTGSGLLARNASVASTWRVFINHVDWWLEELADLLPGWLRRSFNGPDPVRMRRVDGEWQRMGGAGKATPKGDRRAVVVLDKSEVLIRRCELPLSARAHVDEIMRLQISTETPFEPEEVWSDSIIENEGRTGAHLQVRQVIVQREKARAAVTELEALGLQVCGVDALDESGRALGANLLSVEQEKKRSAPVRRMNLMLLGALVICLLLAALSWRAYQARALAEIEAQSAVVTGQAAGALQLNRQIEEAIAAIEALNTRRTDPTEFFNVYELLATIIPENSWLTEINYTPPNVSLEGGSKSSSGLIAALEQSEAVASARFASPVITDPRTMEDAYSIELVLSDASQEGARE